MGKNIYYFHIILFALFSLQTSIIFGQSKHNYKRKLVIENEDMMSIAMNPKTKTLDYSFKKVETTFKPVFKNFRESEFKALIILPFVNSVEIDISYVGETVSFSVEMPLNRGYLVNSGYLKNGQREFDLEYPFDVNKMSVNNIVICENMKCESKRITIKLQKDELKTLEQSIETRKATFTIFCKQGFQFTYHFQQ